MSDAEAVAAEISQGPTREVLQLQYQFAHLLRQFDQEQDARDLAAARALEAAEEFTAAASRTRSRVFDSELEC